MIKGKTVIELTDVNTQEKEVHEDHNMMTNGLIHALTPKFFGMRNILDNGSGLYVCKTIGGTRIVNTLLSGIFLFESVQEENADNYFINEANPITARGTNTAYSGGDTYCGSYNVAESGRQADGTIKLVWDFATNQGNGKISSLSLTNIAAGNVGYGSKDSAKLPLEIVPSYYFDSHKSNSTYANPNVFYTRLNQNSVLIDNVANNRLMFCDAFNNRFGFFTDKYNITYHSSYKSSHFVNCGVFKICVSRIPITKIGIFNDPAILDLTNENYMEISVPQTFLDTIPENKYPSCAWYYDSGFVYLTANNDVWSVGSQLKILKIDVRHDFSMEVLSVTNTTGIDINTYSQTTDEATGLNGGFINICKDYVIAMGSNMKFYRIRMDNNADVTEIKKDGDTCLIDSKNRTISRIGRLFLTSRFGTGQVNSYVINGETAEINPYGLMSNILYNSTMKFVDAGDGMLCYIETSKGFGSQAPFEYYFPVGLCYNPYILFTINNLSEPIIKTADKTMKVIYTLSEDTES